MPYLKKDERKWMDEFIDNLIKGLDGIRRDSEGNVVKDVAGHVNYIISRIVWKLFEMNKNYSSGNSLYGAILAAGSEFYRRKLSKYEDEKIVENGDLE
ncbi:hypothetical protein M0R04_05980 [Candidatus Dojkabacteria bacterium]|jgi:hypothetical protein|nr:hypothetical protein [Candidatus Dojkabacteria bacterium]